MTNSPYSIHSPILGRRLWAMAVSWSRGNEPATQAARDAVIKACRGRRQVIYGSRSVRTAREAVETAARDIRAARSARHQRRYLRSIPMGAPISRGRPPVRLPQGSLPERKGAMRRQSIRAALRGLRFDESPEIVLSDDPAQVGVSQSETLDWDYYAKSCKYPKKVVATTITAPRDWRHRVARRGLAEVGCLITLDAQLLEGTPEGVSLYAATWLEQGRGYEIRARRGYLAIGEGENFHGSSPEQAMSGLRRRLGLKKADAALADLLSRHGLEQLAARNPNLTVTVNDARATGSCEYGIRSWCHRTRLDYEAGSAPLADVYRAYQQAPLPEARKAILHALRRNRVAVLKAA